MSRGLVEATSTPRLAIKGDAALSEAADLLVSEDTEGLRGAALGGEALRGLVAVAAVAAPDAAAGGGSAGADEEVEAGLEAGLLSLAAPLVAGRAAACGPLLVAGVGALLASLVDERLGGGGLGTGLSSSGMIQPSLSP